MLSGLFPFTETLFYGIRRMTAWLKTQGETVNYRRVARLMWKMGLEAIDPKPNLSLPSDDNSYTSVLDAVTNLNAYFSFYNHKRLHQSLTDRTLAIVHFG